MNPVLPIVFIFLGGIAGTLISKVDEEHAGRVKRNWYLARPSNWPPGPVPINYLMDQPISDDSVKKEAITAAIKYISDRTCLTFVERLNKTSRDSAIKFVKNPTNKGVYGDIGRQISIQEIKLDDTFGNQMDVIIQQIIFALGFASHQSRSDRDTYANVDPIDEAALPSQYKIYYTKLFEYNNYLSIPYEYGSALHFGPANLQVHGYKMNITTKNPDYQNTIGTNKVSFLDMEMIIQRYCSNSTINRVGAPRYITTKIDQCKAPLSAPCGNGGYPNPKNCKVCVCPTGFGGAWCLKRQDGYGANLNATTEWQTQVVNLIGAGSALRYKFDEGSYLISARYLAMIQVRVTQMGDEHCHQGCTTGAAEIKLGDPRMSGIRVCCSNLLNKIFETPLNPMPVLVYNRQGSTKFTFQYRALGYGIE